MVPTGRKVTGQAMASGPPTDRNILSPRAGVGQPLADGAAPA
jgi:hypothetical protein